MSSQVNRARRFRQRGKKLNFRLSRPLRASNLRAPFFLRPMSEKNYKDTLLLPKTDFPMKADLVKREPERLEKWEAAGLYQQVLDARKGKQRFVLHDGPPFANGDVHMGTALNKILKDLIVKSRSMLGFRAPFVPGWDCHGLPIEFKVVKESRGLAPAEVRRRAEEFARKYIDIQRRQFKRLGVLGEWENPYLTLAPSYEADIIRSFAVFMEKGLVYQSKKPVYWSTGAQTALAEAEVEYAQRTDPAIYVRFPITDGPVAGKASFVIWTTTPWTLPANVAIAVHPRHEYVVGEFLGGPEGSGPHRFVIARPLLEAFQKDTGFTLQTEIAALRGEELAGSAARHPFLDRKSRVIPADFVTMDTGTGQVHIAPGHGKDDYMAGVQHGLPVLSPVDDYGKLTEDAGKAEWVGKYVFDVNREIVTHLQEIGALLAKHDYTHDYPHCWRSKTPIVFRAVEQFFIRVDAIRGDALKAIDETTWLPHWGRNRIYGTVESRPDWCISRQRTWGVPLPVFYTEKGEPILDGAIARKVADLVEAHGTNLWFEKDDAWWAGQLGLPAGTSRRNDTLDVWIDSGVSHQAVLRRHPEQHFPADVYIEATDQHRGWFQSSLMTSVALNGVAPYRTVITHGFVVDKDGNKISKSNEYTKPTGAEHFVNQYGADILRLWTTTTQYTDEVPFGEEMFKQVAERYRGFRNVLRILLANLHDLPADKASLSGATTVDRWILSRLQGVIAKCRAAYENFDFREVFETLNQFCTVDLSALYVDITKDRMYCDAANSPRRRAAQTVMARCFEAIARLLAPILVFTADEAWEFSGRTTSVHVETFPEVEVSLRDEALEAKVEEWLKLRGLIYQQAIEPARQAKTIAKSLEGAVTLEISEDQRAALSSSLAELEEFFIVSELVLSSGAELKATVIRSGLKQCARCWRHQPTVGADAAHPDLCDRCAATVAG
jgi:isoleucyl-tRNA synthetase